MSEHRKNIKGEGITIDRKKSMSKQTEDLYWDSFLPIFFDRMSYTMKKDMTAEVSPYGLTSAHSIYLIALKLQNGLTLMSLSKFLDLDPANTNRVIKVLRDKDLVYDDRAFENSKKYNIYLTEEGERLATQVMENIRETMNHYFEGIPRDEMLRMRNTLIKVLRNADPNMEGYINSKHDDPFYTHLHLIPLDNDYDTVSWRALDPEEEEEEDKE